MLLIRNAHVYTPEDLGVQDVLIAFDRIVRMAPEIHCTEPDLQVLDAQGKALVPGFIDQHVHICGGGGEGGMHSRTPEFTLSKAITAGVTTLVGLLGTDGFTKNVDILVAKTKALNNEGITAYCLTGSYAYPSQNLTGSVAKDICFVSEILGCKIAIADHRSSHPTTQELIRLLSDIRMAALLSGKVGELHFHVGPNPDGIAQLLEIVKTTDIPIRHLHPTHMGRHLEQAVEFTHLGGFADITAKDDVPDFFPQLIRDADPNFLTISSDSNGSMPLWNERHEMIGMGVGDNKKLYGVVREMVLRGDLTLEQALPYITSNVARALELYPRKGCIRPGADADLVLLDQELNVDSVLARGQLMMENKKVLVKGTFES